MELLGKRCVKFSKVSFAKVSFIVIQCSHNVVTLVVSWFLRNV